MSVLLVRCLLKFNPLFAFTGDLLEILQWRTKRHKISSSLEKLASIQDIDIVRVSCICCHLVCSSSQKRLVLLLVWQCNCFDCRCLKVIVRKCAKPLVSLSCMKIALKRIKQNVCFIVIAIIENVTYTLDQNIFLFNSR